MIRIYSLYLYPLLPIFTPPFRHRYEIDIEMMQTFVEMPIQLRSSDSLYGICVSFVSENTMIVNHSKNLCIPLIVTIPTTPESGST